MYVSPKIFTSFWKTFQWETLWVATEKSQCSKRFSPIPIPTLVDLWFTIINEKLITKIFTPHLQIHTSVTPRFYLLKFTIPFCFEELFAKEAQVISNVFKFMKLFVDRLYLFVQQSDFCVLKMYMLAVKKHDWKTFSLKALEIDFEYYS